MGIRLIRCRTHSILNRALKIREEVRGSDAPDGLLQLALLRRTPYRPGHEDRACSSLNARWRFGTARRVDRLGTRSRSALVGRNE